MKSEHFTLIGLDLLFLGIAGAVSVWGGLPAIPKNWFVILLGLASFRAGRAVSFNLIFIWLRDLVGIVESPDSSGAGNSTEATGQGAKRILGELICCPICSGTWAALILPALHAFVPLFGQVLIYALAGAGIAEVIHWMSEVFEWAGRASRELSGKIGRENSQALEAYIGKEIARKYGNFEAEALINGQPIYNTWRKSAGGEQ